MFLRERAWLGVFGGWLWGGARVRDDGRPFEKVLIVIQNACGRPTTTTMMIMCTATVVACYLQRLHLGCDGVLAGCRASLYAVEKCSLREKGQVVEGGKGAKHKRGGACSSTRVVGRKRERQRGRWILACSSNAHSTPPNPCHQPAPRTARRPKRAPS